MLLLFGAKAIGGTIFTLTEPPVASHVAPGQEFIQEVRITTWKPCEGILERNTKDEVKALIICFSRRYGIDEIRALRIAECESNFRYDAHNSSGASGVYQHLIGYWPGRVRLYEAPEGISPFDAYWNVRISMEMFKRGMWGHWVCT